MASEVVTGIFERFYQKLTQKSALFESREVKCLLGTKGFNYQEFKDQVGAVFMIAKNILRIDPRVNEKDLDVPIKYGNFIDDMLYQAEWLEVTRLALQNDKNTYTQWLSQISHNRGDVCGVPLAFRTHELCVRVLKKTGLPPIGWVPPELFKFHPDLYQFYF